MNIEIVDDSLKNQLPIQEKQAQSLAASFKQGLTCVTQQFQNEYLAEWQNQIKLKEEQKRQAKLLER